MVPLPRKVIRKDDSAAKTKKKTGYVVTQKTTTVDMGNVCEQPLNDREDVVTIVGEKRKRESLITTQISTTQLTTQLATTETQLSTTQNQKNRKIGLRNERAPCLEPKDVDDFIHGKKAFLHKNN